MTTNLECPVCKMCLDIEVDVTGDLSQTTEARPTGCCVICLHCFAPSRMLDDATLGPLDLDSLDPEDRQELLATIEAAKGNSCSFRHWVSILSAHEQIPTEALPFLLPNGPIPVFHTGSNHEPVGRALEYEVRGDTIWALLELETRDFARAATLVDYGKGGPVLKAVVLTNLPRSELHSLSRDLRAKRVSPLN